MKGIVKIEKLPNGAHQNQLGQIETIPEGWAVIPDEMELPATFPFVELMAEEIDGVLTVSVMTEGIMPEPTPEQPPEPTLAARVSVLEDSSAELAEALDMLLAGVTE